MDRRCGSVSSRYRVGMFAAQDPAGSSGANGTQPGSRIGMLDTVAALLTYQAAIYFATGTAPLRMGNRHPTIVPYETFTAADGDFVLAVGNDDQWRRFCRVAGMSEEERFATNRDRVTRYAELRPILAARIQSESRQWWIAQLVAAGVPCGSVRDLHEVFADPQLASREMTQTVDHALHRVASGSRRPGEAVRDRPGRSARHRRHSASTPRRCWARTRHEQW